VNGPAAEHARLRLALGPYVLGALSEADTAMVERHLAECRRCLDECADLEDIPAYLDVLAESDFPQAPTLPGDSLPE